MSDRSFLAQNRWTWGLIWLAALLALVWGPRLFSQTPSRLTPAQQEGRVVRGYRAFFNLTTQDTLVKLVRAWTRDSTFTGRRLSAMERGTAGAVTRDERMALALVFDSLYVQQFDPTMHQGVARIWYDARSDSVKRRLWRNMMGTALP